MISQPLSAIRRAAVAEEVFDLAHWYPDYDEEESLPGYPHALRLNMIAFAELNV